MSNYRWCGVPQCTNTTLRTPGKLFVHVPVKPEIRTKWLKLARRNADHLSPRSKMHFCEDHFDLEKDMLNYMEFSMTGSVKRKRLRDGCLPSKFECQGRDSSKGKPRSAVAKRQKIATSQECDRILEEYRINEEKAQMSTVTGGNESDMKQNKNSRKREISSDSSSTDEKMKQAAINSEQETPTPVVIKVEPQTDADPVLSESATPAQYVLKGKRFVNVGYLIKSLQKLNDHGRTGCNFSDMDICGETKEGWNIGVQLSCRVCFISAVVWMEDPDTKLIKTRPNVSDITPLTQPPISPKIPLKTSKPHPRRTPTPPPDNSMTQFLVPLPLASSVFLPQSKEVPKAKATKQYLRKLPILNPTQATTFINQEIIQGGCSYTSAQSTEPASVQLLFFVDQPESSQMQNPPTATSSVESINVVPDVFVGSQNRSSTSLGTSTTSENITITPDMCAADVLPVDLNLVKKEVEDEPESGHQSMDVDDKTGICLVPMSETSLDPSHVVFDSDDSKLLTSTETPKASSSASDIKISSGKFKSTTRSICSKYKKLINKENAPNLPWKYFGLPADENGRVVDNSIAVCKICRKCMKYSVGRTTSYMVRHLKLRHPSKYKDTVNYSKLVKKKKAKSIIWKHFRLPVDENGLRVDNTFTVCEICMNRVSSKGGNTSNMFGHLKLHHPTQYKDILRESKYASSQNEVDSRKRSTSIKDVLIMKEQPGNEISQIQKTMTVSLSTQPLDTESPKYSKFLSKKIPVSIIRKHFGLPTDEYGLAVDSKTVVCKICNLYRSENTFNMHKHLKLHHPLTYKSLYEELKCSIPPTYSLNKNEVSDLNRLCPIKNLQDTPALKEETCLLDSQSLDSHSSDNCIDSITKFLVFTLQPYTLVEMKSFVNMIRNINPSYRIPSRKYFSKTGIPKLYNETLEKLKQNISIVKGKEISITIDCWTSVANTSYVAITIHFIDHQWNLKSACLNCSCLEANPTFTDICNTLTGALSNWELDVTNVTCCTADNDSNIFLAKNYLQLPHISCFGHSLNIGINGALGINCLEKPLSKLKQLQRAISQNWKMKRDLATAQESLQMEIVDLPSTCPTRWRSTLKLIRRFLSNQSPIGKMLVDYPDQKHLMPDSSEVSALEHFVANTKLLEDITTTLSGEEYVSASSIWPLYRKIKKSLQCHASEDEISKQIKSKILSALSDRYEKDSVKTILWMSSLCDPRFRLNFTDNANDIKEIALQKMAFVYKTINTSPSNQPDPSDTQKKGLEKLFEFEDSSSDDDSLPGNKAQAELNKYLSMPKINLNVSPFVWWKSHEGSFPVLKILARKYLAIQGSSVPSDRVFSTKGSVITRQRAALLPKHAERQIFIAENKTFLK